MIKCLHEKFKWGNKLPTKLQNRCCCFHVKKCDNERTLLQNPHSLLVHLIYLLMCLILAITCDLLERSYATLALISSASVYFCVIILICFV